MVRSCLLWSICYHSIIVCSSIPLVFLVHGFILCSYLQAINWSIQDHSLSISMLLLCCQQGSNLVWENIIGASIVFRLSLLGAWEKTCIIMKICLCLLKFSSRMLQLLQWDQSRDFRTTTGSDAGRTCSATRLCTGVYHVYSLQRQDKIATFGVSILWPQHSTLYVLEWRNFFEYVLFFRYCPKPTNLSIMIGRLNWRGWLEWPPGVFLLRRDPWHSIFCWKIIFLC